MDGTLGNLKVWKCGKGHVLGLMRRDRNKTKEQREFWVSRLMLFRQALDETEDLKKGDVIALIEGTTLDVKCSVPGCGCARTWWTGEDALERLIGQTKNG